MKRALTLSIALLVALSLVFVGCAKKSAEKTRTAAEKKAAAVKPVEKASDENCACVPPPEGVTVKPEVKHAAEDNGLEEMTKPAAKPAATKPAVKTPTAAKPVSKPAGIPTLIDLGGENCIPCKMMKPILDGLKSEYSGKLKVEVYDIQKDEEIAKKYPVRVIPTQIFFDANGKELERHFGFISKEDILATFEKHGINLEKE